MSVAGRVSIHALSWRWWNKECLAVFEEVRDTVSLAALRRWLAPELLTEERYILTGRRFLLFGPSERKLLHAPELLRNVLLAQNTVPLSAGHALTELTEALRTAGQHSELVAQLDSALTPEHAVPEWIRDGTGPSILPPPQTRTLVECLTEAAGSPVLEDAELKAFHASLIAFLKNAEATWWDLPSRS